MTRNYLLFLLCGRVFGAGLTGAIEILPWRPSRPVPLSYSYVEGLLDYRGMIYPVHNLGLLLGLVKPGRATEGQGAALLNGRSVILFEEKNVPLGIVVDSVLKMTTLEAPLAGPGKAEDLDPRYIKGFCYEAGQKIVILDFERLLHAG